MAARIKRLVGRALAPAAVLGLFTLQGCIHPRALLFPVPPGHLHIHARHHQKRPPKPKGKVILVAPRPPLPPLPGAPRPWK